MITNPLRIENPLICKSIFFQARGLMFRPKRNLVIVFPKERRIKLHMFFVFYPIDVLILDKDKRIVEIKRNFRPFTFWNAQKKGKYVVELAYPKEYEIGNKLEF